jgi:transcriptional activator of cad operon
LFEAAKQGLGSYTVAAQKAVAGRTMPNVTAGTFKVGDWVVSPQLDELSRDGRTIKLEPRMMRLLVRLAESPGEVLSTPQLLDSVWSGVVVGPASVYQAVSALRKLLGDTDPAPTYIATVIRKGYRLIAPVTTCIAAGAESQLPTDEAAPRNGRRWLAATGLLAIIAIAGWSLWQSRSEPTVVHATLAPIGVGLTKLPRIVVPDFIQAENGGDEGKILAIGVSEVLRERLVRQDALLLSASNPGYKLQQPGVDFEDAMKRVAAEYVLKGTADRVNGRLRLIVQLFRTTTGEALWSQSFDRPETALTQIREEIVAKIGSTLHVPIRSMGNLPVNIDELQMRMQAQLMTFDDPRPDHLERAQILARRATILYPHCARCYLAQGNALYFQKLPGDTFHQRADQARVAVDHALSLDPELAEALLSKADLAGNVDTHEHTGVAVASIEQMYRRAIEIAPSLEWAYAGYGHFLEHVGRIGEATDLYGQALAIDPLSDSLVLTEAVLAGFALGDVPKFDRLMHQAMTLCPDCGHANLWLARSRMAWSGETAEALKLAEDRIAKSPSDFDLNPFTAAAYLEVDDPEAAVAVAGKNPLVQVQLAQYQRQPQHPSQLPDGVKEVSWPPGPGLGFNALAEALRDEAIHTRQFGAALDALALVYRSNRFPPPLAVKSAIVSTHVLMLSGAAEQARDQAHKLLSQLDEEAVGRPSHWFARDRASLFMLLGDEEQAIAELQESQKRNNFVRWWYTGEIDPLFAPLHSDPRFQQLVATARKHRVEQRALVDEMRRRGDLPTRIGPAARAPR